MGRLPGLRKGDQFDTAYQEGSLVQGTFFIVRWRANGLEEARWGFAVGKRMAKHAVVRNRLRRQMREVAAAAPPLSGVDIVVTARGPALGRPFTVLSSALAKQLERVRQVAG